MPHKFVFMEMKLNHRKNIKSLKEILNGRSAMKRGAQSEKRNERREMFT